MWWKNRRNSAMCFESNSNALFVIPKVKIHQFYDFTILSRLSGYFYYQFQVDSWYFYFGLTNALFFTFLKECLLVHHFDLKWMFKRFSSADFFAFLNLSIEGYVDQASTYCFFIMNSFPFPFSKLIQSNSQEFPFSIHHNKYVEILNFVKAWGTKFKN